MRGDRRHCRDRFRFTGATQTAPPTITPTQVATAAPIPTASAAPTVTARTVVLSEPHAGEPGVAVTMSGLGWRMDHGVPTKGCDEGHFAAYGTAEDNLARYHQGPGQIDAFRVLDVDGATVIIDAMYRPDTPAEVVAELRGVAESAGFTLP